MGASNMSIQTTGESSYMERPSMQQEDHPEHNMPDPEHNGTELPSNTAAIDAMANEYRNTPNAHLRMRELGSMRSRAAKER